MKLSELITLATVKMAKDGDVDVEVEVAPELGRPIPDYKNIVGVDDDYDDVFTLITE